jgi:hypothetical protein
MRPNTHAWSGMQTLRHGVSYVNNGVIYIAGPSGHRHVFQSNIADSGAEYRRLNRRRMAIGV